MHAATHFGETLVMGHGTCLKVIITLGSPAWGASGSASLGP